MENKYQLCAVKMEGFEVSRPRMEITKIYKSLTNHRLQKHTAEYPNK